MSDRKCCRCIGTPSRNRCPSIRSIINSIDLYRGYFDLLAPNEYSRVCVRSQCTHMSDLGVVWKSPSTCHTWIASSSQRMDRVAATSSASFSPFASCAATAAAADAVACCVVSASCWLSISAACRATVCSPLLAGSLLWSKLENRRVCLNFRNNKGTLLYTTTDRS